MNIFTKCKFQPAIIFPLMEKLIDFSSGLFSLIMLLEQVRISLNGTLVIFLL